MESTGYVPPSRGIHISKTTSDATVKTFRGYVQDPPDDNSELVVTASNVDILLTSANTNQGSTGYTPNFGSDVHNIPNSSYFRDRLDPDDGSDELDTEELHTVDVYRPEPGTYQVTVSSDQLTVFSLNVGTFAPNSTETPEIVTVGISAPGSTTTFALQVDTTAGSSTTAKRVATFASMVQDINNSQQLGLITDSRFLQCLLVLVRNASKAYEANDYVGMKSCLIALKRSINGAVGSTVSAPSDQILKEDIDSLFALAPTDPIYPVINCVHNNGDGTYTATFGYQNSNGTAVQIPAGSQNFVSVPGQNPPTVFNPGANYLNDLFNNGAPRITFSGTYLLWTLQGPDGIVRTATISTSSASCMFND